MQMKLDSNFYDLIKSLRNFDYSLSVKDQIWVLK